jgi:transcriptional regulator with XRE-family HTH domain
MTRKQTALNVRRRRRQLTPNETVALNIAVLRHGRGWTQTQFAERLAPFIGQRWSKAVVSAVERTADGKRVRQFDANELVAIARTFDVSIGVLFLSGSTSPLPYGMWVPDRPAGLPDDEVFQLAIGLGAAVDARVRTRAARQIAVEGLQGAVEQMQGAISRIQNEEKEAGQ